MPFRRGLHGLLEPLIRSIPEVLDLLSKDEVKFVDLQFADLAGSLRHVTIPRREVDEDLFKEGAPKLDGSSVKGFSQVHDSDMVLKPDPNTYAIIPWLSEKYKTARFICDVYWGFKRGRLESDPRYIAQRAEEYLRSEGFTTSYWGSEVEFFVFDKTGWDVLNAYRGQSYYIASREAAWNAEASSSYPIRFKEGYLLASPYDTLMEFRFECVKMLEEFFNVYCGAHHREVATAGQQEIDIYRDTLVNMADSIVTLKYVVKNVAKSMNLLATFMPKPIFNDNASGMHIHVSLWKDCQNIFYDPNDSYAELSQLGRYFVGGLKEHAKSLTAITCPTTNSYKRLVPGFEAPVYIVWGKANRSACIRIPAYHKGAKAALTKRVEYRPPDPSANPYLCLAAILAAGLDGIKKKIDPGDPIDENVYLMTPERRRALGIETLPSSLKQAIEELQSDMEYLKPVFTREAMERFVEIINDRYVQVAIRPHPYEFYLYFDS
ncbi:MAG: type I glutamate--ammonia ligase [Candidatus Nezhaarchaeota archaeon]|nr:type I glutamate--ammonia ligase [Candidatus Nezhaarchaeota archaeon]MCX8141648.1 type I glutamate--ammonia ligase [Candidatus Nezhaarchaeota archaeon]MDW8049915.1 type I glutamate--ammonia ligase [Nitrososphaerota archaeon]